MMWVKPEDDPRLENVRERLTNLRTLIDEADWQDKPIDAAIRNEANRLTHMTNDSGQLRCPSCWLKEKGEQIKPIDRGGYRP